MTSPTAKNGWASPRNRTRQPSARCIAIQHLPDLLRRVAELERQPGAKAETPPRTKSEVYFCDLAAASWIFFRYLAGSFSKSFLQFGQHSLTSWPLYTKT